MQIKYTYLLIDIGALLIPLIFSFHRRIQFHKHWKAFMPSILTTALLFVLWDIYYTSLGVWGFNNKYITGIKIFDLPLEEILFFVCIPYASVFTYFCFRNFELNLSWRTSKGISIFLSSVLLATGIFMYDKLYTSATFIALGLVLIYVSFLRKSNWLPTFYLMFLAILLPFFIVNGLLTGTGLEEAVVWYNDNENLSIRLLTIPVEDIFYGMLLLLINTMLFEQFGKYAR